MLCKVCGRTASNEEANFCEYCGASFRSGEVNPYPNFEYGAAGQNQGMNGNLNTMEANSTMGGFPYANNMNVNSKANEGEIAEKPMTFANWIMVLILPFIPVVGSFVYIAVLFIWGFGANTPKTRKNWARATLLILAIALAMIFVLYGGPSGLLSSFGLAL